MNETGPEVQKIEGFLQTLLFSGGLDLSFEISACNGQVQSESSTPARPASEPSTSTPRIRVELSGPDTPLLTARNGELLHAIEHLTAKVLRLEPEQHDQIYFDADNFKATRDRELRLAAAAGVESVRSTQKPYAFPPMNSRERRLLHLVLSESGLPTASSGDGPRRYVVVYPQGHSIVAEPRTPYPTSPAPAGDASDRTRAIRNAFRRR